MAIKIFLAFLIMVDCIIVKICIVATSDFEPGEYFSSEINLRKKLKPLSSMELSINGSRDSTLNNQCNRRNFPTVRWNKDKKHNVSNKNCIWRVGDIIASLQLCGWSNAVVITMDPLREDSHSKNWTQEHANYAFYFRNKNLHLNVW